MTDSSAYILIFALMYWVALATVWCYCSHGIFRENKKIKEDLPTLPTMNYLLSRLAALQRRNLQLWCAVTVLFAMFGISNLSGIIRSVAAPPPVEMEVVTPPPVNSQQMDKPIQPRPAPAEPPKTASLTSGQPVPAGNALPYSDITEFNEKDSKQQAMIDWLKQRYENSFITYYYLQKCGMAEKNDFDLIRASLHKELTDLHTETSAAEENILMAANGSYNELYSQASCTDDRIKATKASYDDFMKQMRQPSVIAPAVTQSPQLSTIPQPR